RPNCEAARRACRMRANCCLAIGDGASFGASGAASVRKADQRSELMRVSDEQIREWFENGYVVIPAFLSAAEVERVRANASRYVPSWSEFEANPDRFDGIRRSPAVKWEFPFVDDALNDVTTHPAIVDLVER